MGRERERERERGKGWPEGGRLPARRLAPLSIVEVLNVGQEVGRSSSKLNHFPSMRQPPIVPSLFQLINYYYAGDVVIGVQEQKLRGVQDAGEKVITHL